MRFDKFYWEQLKCIQRSETLGDWDRHRLGYCPGGAEPNPTLYLVGAKFWLVYVADGGKILESGYWK